jgi:hypothetical protein
MRLHPMLYPAHPTAKWSSHNFSWTLAPRTRVHHKSRKQKAESRKQKAESRKQKAVSRKQKAESRKHIPKRKRRRKKNPLLKLANLRELQPMRFLHIPPYNMQDDMRS